MKDPSIHATINFAASHDSGWVFSNYDPTLNTIVVTGHDVEVANARMLATPPSLDGEGFELHRLSFADPNLFDPEWVAQIYGPRTLEFVRQATGAAHVEPFRGHRVLVRDSGARPTGRATVADFVHIDQTEQSGTAHVRRDADPSILEKWPHVRIYNVWRSITPGPQDLPLGLCDQRSIEKADWVKGEAREPGVAYGTDTYTSVFNPRQRWHYFPDMSEDEIILFKAWDNDPDAPIGCLHGAFRDPTVTGNVQPRISAESRYICFFEN